MPISASGAVERGEQVIVGVNRYADDKEPDIPIQDMDEAAIAEQRQRVAGYRARHDRERRRIRAPAS